MAITEFGLPNLIMGRRCFPELVQDEYTGQGIANALNGFIDRGAMTTAINAVRTQIGERDFIQCIGEGIDGVFDL